MRPGGRSARREHGVSPRLHDRIRVLGGAGRATGLATMAPHAPSAADLCFHAKGAGARQSHDAADVVKGQLGHGGRVVLTDLGPGTRRCYGTRCARRFARRKEP